MQGRLHPVVRVYLAEKVADLKAKKQAAAWTNFNDCLSRYLESRCDLNLINLMIAAGQLRNLLGGEASDN